MSFFELLEKRASKTLLCIGLDPRSSTAAGAVQECKNLIDLTKDVAAAFKPNAAFFEVFGHEGWAALAEVVNHVPANIPVILDAKRGDIADTAEAYAKSAFVHLKANAITVAPYMGGDSIAPFTKDASKGVFVLCKTSNKGSNELQTLKVGGKFLYEIVAERAQTSWNGNKNVGLVVGATDPSAIARVRARAPGLWFLVPGVGAQGGDLKSALDAGLRRDRSGMIINVSRAVAAAKDPKSAAKQLCDEINAIRFQVPPNTEVASALVTTRCVKFGSFKLKSGKMSPIYIDLRRLVTYPDVLKLVAKAYAGVLRKYQFDRIVGLPYAALPIATAISLEMGVPLIYPRREAKEYGTKASIEGEYKEGETVVIIDDLISTGETKVEAIEKLTGAKLKIAAIVVLIDREMGAKKFLNDMGYAFEAVVGLKTLLPLWKASGAVSEQQLEEVRQFLSKL